MSSRGHQEEQQLAETNDVKLLLRLWQFVKPYRGLFWISMLLLPATSACLLAQPYIVKRAIDDYIAAGTVDGLGW